jgi:acyl-CoA synthetase (AMP-forming)/AMP-acid ligase II
VTLNELLDEATARGEDRPFLLSEEGVVTYGEARERIHGLAWLFADLGLRHGSRVAVVLPNVPETIYTWFALARLGAVMVPINPALVAAEVEPLLHDLGVEGIVGPAKTVATYLDRLGLRAGVVVGGGEMDAVDAADAADVAVRFAAPPRPAPPVPDRPVSAADELTILQSSGTTGRPKSALLTHASYVVPAREFGRWMEITSDDRFLGCLPLFHMAGQAFAASAVAAGAALALVGRFSAHHFWEQVRTHEITLVRHLGEMLALLCRQPAQEDDRRHSLRAVYGGGARVDVAEAFERRFGVAVVEGYGLTETNTVLRNELRRRRPGALGLPLPYSEVRIAGEQGNALPPFEIGEIQVRRNPVMTTGYVGEAGRNEASFRDGWFRTGDLGYHDADGYFYFTGRHKDLIRRRGENIFPGGIEKVLDQHPAVVVSAVVGVPDEVGGEEVKAFLICRPEIVRVPEDFVAWCRPWLAEFEIPRYFEVCNDLPRTATNKINKSELRRLGSAGGCCFDRRAGSEAGGRPSVEHGLEIPIVPEPLLYTRRAGEGT